MPQRHRSERPEEKAEASGDQPYNEAVKRFKTLARQIANVSNKKGRLSNG
jgi:hypothetical protein